MRTITNVVILYLSLSNVSSKTFLLLLFLIPFYVYPQGYSANIQVKSSVLNVKQFNNSEYNQALEVYPLGIYLGNKFILSEKYQFEISPGYFFGGENFSGIDVGFQLRRYLLQDKVFGAIELVFHYNFGSAHGLNRIEYAPEGIFTNVGLSTGIELNKNISFVAGYLKTLSEDYGYTLIYDNQSSGMTKKYNRNLFGLIQIGVKINI